MVYVVAYLIVHICSILGAAYLSGFDEIEEFIVIAMMGPLALVLSVSERVAIAGRRQRELAAAKHKADLAALNAVEAELALPKRRKHG